MAEDRRPQIVNAVLMMGAVIFIGTVGYKLIGGDQWTLLDGLYMTVITVATIGYGETHPLTTGGRVFTIFLIAGSIGTAGYALTVLARFIIEGEFKQLIRGRIMDNRIARLNNHIILCGGGGTGRCVAEELLKTGTPFVAIERDPEELAHLARLGDVLQIQGDATEDETLQTAGIGRAKGLIASLPEDKDNLYIVLSARSLNAKLRIVTRVADEVNSGKLRKAGADELVSPNAIGGLRLASMMIRPTVVGFLDTMIRHKDKTMRVEEVTLAGGTTLVGKTLAEAQVGQRTGTLVMAIKPKTGDPVFNPDGQTRIGDGDTLIVVGTPEQVEQLRKLS